MRKTAVAQVALLNVAVGLAVLPLESTLNRVMITELGFSATLTALLVSLRFLTSPLRVWFGRVSDRYPLLGRRRAPYIALGMLLTAAGLAMTPHAAFAAAEGGVGALLFAVFAFGLFGFGVNMTTPLYFAAVSDQSTEAERPRIVAVMFVALGVAVVIGAALLGSAVDPYSAEKLVAAMAVLSLIVLGLSALGLVGLEKPGQPSARDDAPTSDWSVIKRLLLDSRQARLFFGYLLLTFIAVDAQEVVLEPYAAAAFDMSAGDTTRLTAIFRTGFLVMLIAGVQVVSRLGRGAGARVGMLLAAAGLATIAATGAVEAAGAFRGGVFLLGLGAGQIAVANLSLMMDMTAEEHAGASLGAWGLAQAVGVGGGTLLGGVWRDLSAMVFGEGLAGYWSVFALEVVALIAAWPLLGRLNVARYREHASKVSFQTAASKLADG